LPRVDPNVSGPAAIGVSRYWHLGRSCKGCSQGASTVTLAVCFRGAKAGLANTMAQINVSADMRPNLANLTSIHLRGVSRYFAFCLSTCLL
jgi:hypothetical protein